MRGARCFSLQGFSPSLLLEKAFGGEQKGTAFGAASATRMEQVSTTTSLLTPQVSQPISPRLGVSSEQGVSLRMWPLCASNPEWRFSVAECTRKALDISGPHSLTCSASLYFLFLPFAALSESVVRTQQPHCHGLPFVGVRAGGGERALSTACEGEEQQGRRPAAGNGTCAYESGVGSTREVE